MKSWFKNCFAREEAPQKVSRPTVDPSGRACFPEGITEIPDYTFDGNTQLRTAVLPKTVKRIGTRAFADCPNFIKLVLNEGLERIDGNAFTGCTALKSLVFPDSVKEVEAFAFYRSAFETPVFNASGDTLYRCPEIPDQKKYIVPGHVKRIQAGAFLYHTRLEEVILPEGVEYIHCRSFIQADIRKLTLPASIKHVEAKSFWSCKMLEEVVVLCDKKVLDTAAFHDCPNAKLIAPGQSLDFEESRRIRGLSVLTLNRRLTVPKRDFWKDPVFAALARRCAAGDTDAMMELASHYETLGTEEFYTSAANFWRYRAYLYGNPQAIQWKKDWFLDKPETLIPVALNPYLSGADGDKLRALGFEFFDPEREYSIDQKDPNGVVEVSSWCDTEGPDEDGFGMEELYDWWFMDEFLNPIPGARVLNGWSHNERRTSPELYAQNRAQAGELLRELKSKR